MLNKKFIVFFCFIVLINIIYHLYKYNFNNNIEQGHIEGFTDYFDNKQIYDDFYSKIYDKLFYSEQKNNHELNELNIKIFSKRSNKFKKTDIHILDMGCGTGRHIKYLGKKYKITGLDRSKSMLKIAEKNNKGNKNAKFILGDINNTKLFKDNTFSHILCLYFTFYYIENKRKFFENIYNKLKKNGILCLHLVNRKKFDPILQSASPWPMFSTQRYQRHSKSTLVFNTFRYEAEFELDIDTDMGYFKEKIEFNKSKDIRNNNHTFYMPSIRKIIGIARDYKFKLRGYSDLTNLGFEYQYIFYFQK